jgi:hypothetical protein
MKGYHLIAEFTLVSGMDSSGVYGGIFHYALVFAMVGSAFLAFIYFWSKGKLDMDEGPKLQMMCDEEGEECNGCKK